MNNNYYGKPIFPNNNINTITPPSNGNYTSNIKGFEPMALPAEQSYIENILRLNKGKKAKLHVTVPGSIEWQDRVFDGIIEQAGKDHVIVSNPTTGEWYLILIIYLDFVTFEEPINYAKQFYT